VRPASRLPAVDKRRPCRPGRSPLSAAVAPAGRWLPVAWLLALWLSAASAQGQAPALPQPNPSPPPDSDSAPAELDLPALVGLTLTEALQSFGAPEQVFCARGAESWQDDVVFYYPGHLYLFWYQNRVWQARVDEHHAGAFLASRALSMGRSREEVLAMLGPPMRELGDSLVYHLEDRGYPVRLRLYFREGRLADAYCYRGDL
jgi:hypothetical protein